MFQAFRVSAAGHTVLAVLLARFEDASIASGVMAVLAGWNHDVSLVEALRESLSMGRRTTRAMFRVRQAQRR